MRLLAFLLSFLLCAPASADIEERLTVEEEDGTPSTQPFKLKVSNNTLTDNLDGTASLAIAAGGGDSILIDGSAIGDAAGVDLIGGLTGIDIALNTGASPDTATFAFDATELTNLTWSANGSASIIWTGDVSGTDTTLTWGSNLITLSGDLTLDDGSGNSPAMNFPLTTGTDWILQAIDSDDDFYVFTTTGAVEGINFTNAGVGSIMLIIDSATTGGITLGNTDPADAGVLRLENAANACWEAAPAGADACLTVDSNELFTMTSGLTVTGTMSATTVEGANVTSGANPGHTHTTTSLSGIDIGDDTNLAAGRSLTLSGDSVEADAELFTDTKCLSVTNPTGADFQSVWFAKQAATLTSLWCESDQTVTAMVQVDDGSVADVDGTDMTCDATPPEDTSLNGDATMASGDRLDLDVASVASSPTWVRFCWTFTYDD